MIGYHELTVNQPIDTKSRHQQFLVICTVMFAAFIHSFVVAGGFDTVRTTSAAFPGGEFCYKYTTRDYATSSSLADSIGKDIGFNNQNIDDGYVDAMYTLYLDSPMILSAERLRFAVGHFAQTPEAKKINHDILLKKNKRMVPLTKAQFKKLPVQEIWPRLPYHTASLPKTTQALVAHFPFTDGFVSTLMFTYKIMPALLKQAKEAGMKEPVVVMSTCSVRQRMCTHYTLSGKAFLLGQPDTTSYASTLLPQSILPWTDMWNTLIQPLVWTGILADADADASDEL